MAKCLKIAKSENFSFSYKYRKNTPNISKEIFLKRNCSVSIWIFEKKQIFLFIIVLKSLSSKCKCNFEILTVRERDNK